jgi:TolB protein
MSKRLALLGALAAFATAAAAAMATTPGTNGQIAFRRYLNADQSRSALFTMNADGTNVRQIVGPARNARDDQPDWAPDASRLVFTRCPDEGSCGVMAVNADGSGLRRVTPRCTRPFVFPRIPRGCSDAANASFTPDGQHVLYTRASGRIRVFKELDTDQIEHSAVAIVGADGTGRRDILRLPRFRGDANFPQMSPDGRFILFERRNSPLGKPTFGQAIFVMNADGSNVHRVTPWKLRGGDNPDWAPDSSKLLFHSNEGADVERAQFYTVRPDGSGLTQLTHFPFAKQRLFSASFSPDGRQIVFAKADAKGRGDAWIMNADGSGARLLLNVPPWDSAPDWAAAPQTR